MAKKKKAKKKATSKRGGTGSTKRTRKKKSKLDIFADTTNRIIEMIEADGLLPWQKPWKGDRGFPTNLSSGKEYRGINIFILGFSPYACRYWLTFKQAKELAVKEARKAGRKIKQIVETKEGKACRPWYLDEDTGEAFLGGIKKGEKKYGYVVFWKWIDYSRTEADENGDEKVIDSSVPMLRFTPIFNALQTSGITIPQPEKEKDFSPVAECEKLLESYKHGPTVNFGGDRACYSPILDTISCPKPDTFKTPEDYYSVLFHEHIHGTGHERRLNRKTLTAAGYFGGHNYSEEELVAQMGSSFLSAITGVHTPKVEENSAAYLKHWMAKIKSDPKLLVHSASRAQKAVDFIRGTKFEKQESEPTNGGNERDTEAA